ncbi:Ig-like domain-containing protein [Streptomyces sp. ACA25]|uniref:L,D-transpeptidase n=1 Tax=Streptomyces sp. ACA25 TaxID=3022596 RepID=UPI0023077057|nr:Ig-like domain-containing protein [Streptomyces sp. ACA25]MDB1088302.1 Ig-like domain-containing protein [Streptomyces sp. ACA25]
MPAAAAALLAVVLLLVSACSASSKAEEKGGSSDGKPGAAAAVHVAISPEDGAQDVPTSGVLRVTSEDGALREVTVTDEDGAEIPGELSEDGAGWEPSEHLANATTYSVAATVEDTAGDAVTEQSTFTTVAAERTFSTSWNIADGATVGVGMVLSLTFDTPIENTAEVRDSVTITAGSGTEVRGHWFGTQRLDFRPEEYWEAGTEVDVSFRVRGVEGAPGVYGTLHRDLSFTVGRSQVSTVDVDALTMTVVRDGEVLDTVPITAGKPGMDTWNGKMVISEKHEELRMDGATVGYDYDIPDVPHAMRLSTSGTFLHGNYWSSPGTFGGSLDTHGCIGLRDVQGGGDGSTPSAWFFQNSMLGDVVEVINSADDVIAPDNGLNGWNMSWSEWGAGQ